MLPPRCAICSKTPREDGIKCGRVSFTLTETEKAYNQRMIANRRVGPLKGSDWFCQQHIDLARQLKHLSKKDAIKAMLDQLASANNDPTAS